MVSRRHRTPTGALVGLPLEWGGLGGLLCRRGDGTTVCASALGADRPIRKRPWLFGGTPGPLYRWPGLPGFGGEGSETQAIKSHQLQLQSVVRTRGCGWGDTGRSEFRLKAATLMLFVREHLQQAYGAKFAESKLRKPYQKRRVSIPVPFFRAFFPVPERFGHSGFHDAVPMANIEPTNSMGGL